MTKQAGLIDEEGQSARLPIPLANGPVPLGRGCSMMYEQATALHGIMLTADGGFGMCD